MRRIIVSGLTALLLALGAAWWFHGKRAPVHGTLSLPRGTELVYDVAWTSNSDALLHAAGGGRIHGAVDIAAHLVLRSYGKIGDALFVAVSLDQFTRHQLTIVGQNALPDPAVFDGRSATAELDSTGRVRAVSFRREDPEVFKQVVRTLLADAQFSVADGETWTAREVTSTGTVDSAYRAVASDTIVRDRATYARLAALGERSDQQLSSHAEAVLADGYLASLEATETLHVGDELAIETRLQLHRVASRTFVPVPLPTLTDRRAPEAVVVPADTKKQMLDQRIAGLTVAQMRLDLLELVHTGSLPGGPDWLLRASGLLIAEPAGCEELAELFESDEVNARGRAQILDLLAGTGTPAAQDAMRTALASSAARPQFAALLQRFSSVAHPTAETLAFVRDAFHAATGDDRLAAAYALGAIGGHGDAAMAKVARDELLQALESMPAQRHHLALALGNVGSPDDAPTFARLARDDNDDVRASAAWALRSIDTREARGTLVSLSVDSDPRVADTALRAMAKLHLEPDEVAALATSVEDDGVPAAADSALVAVLASHAKDASVRRALERMLARRADDKPMQARIRAVLAM